jgi:hypothetical protein
MSDYKIYLVRFATDRFFRQRTADGKAALGSPYMSLGTNMTYLVATEIAKILQEMGYGDALVCDRLGKPVSLASIQNPQQPDIDEFLQVWMDTPIDAPKEVTVEH